MKNGSCLDKCESRADKFCRQIRYKVERKRGNKDNPKVLALATGRVKLPFTKMEKRQEEEVTGRICGVLLPAQEVGDSCYIAKQRGQVGRWTYGREV